MIHVELICVLPDQVWRQAGQVALGTTAAQWLAQTTLPAWLEQHGVTPVGYGVYGQKITPADHVLTEGDRVEVYRALTRDPKDVRRRRADLYPVGRRRRQK
jgi:putative ubiquitin-RnfH superfamily antitoxin RatB of RatAB toxin-antitoxin module